MKWNYLRLDWSFPCKKNRKIIISAILILEKSENHPSWCDSWEWNSCGELLRSRNNKQEYSKTSKSSHKVYVLGCSKRGNRLQTNEFNLVSIMDFLLSSFLLSWSWSIWYNQIYRSSGFYTLTQSPSSSKRVAFTSSSIARTKEIKKNQL